MLIAGDFNFDRRSALHQLLCTGALFSDFASPPALAARLSSRPLPANPPPPGAAGSLPPHERGEPLPSPYPAPPPHLPAASLPEE